MKSLTAAALLVALAAGPVSARPPAACVPDDAARDRAGRYDAIILRHAERRRLNPRLVKAIIAAESQFAAGAVSPRGARGLMQLMPDTALEMGVPPRSLSNPEANIRAGTRYLALLFSALRHGGALRPGDARALGRVIAAYHSGPGALKGEDWSSSTRSYVSTVLSCYRSEASALRRPAADARLALLTPAERPENERR